MLNRLNLAESAPVRRVGGALRHGGTASSHLEENRFDLAVHLVVGEAAGSGSVICLWLTGTSGRRRRVCSNLECRVLRPLALWIS